MNRQEQHHRSRFTPAAPHVGVLKGGWRAMRELWRMEDSKEFTGLVAMAIIWSLGWAALLGYGLAFMAIGAGQFRQSRKPRSIIEPAWRGRASDAMMLVVIILLAGGDQGLASIAGSQPSLSRSPLVSLIATHVLMGFTGFLLGWIAGSMVWPVAHAAWRLSLCGSGTVRRHRHPVRRTAGRTARHHAYSPSGPVTSSVSPRPKGRMRHAGQESTHGR